jgi:hypothetical protein
VNVLDAISDRKIFGKHFRNPKTWQNWLVFLTALFALPMSEDQLAVYRQFTGRNTPPTKPSHEAWLVIGRRGGKSFILALIAVFLASFKDWRAHLGPGEVGTIMVIAADRKQARTIMRFALGLLQSVPMLKQQIEGVTQQSITLKNSIAIEIHTASFKSTRGYTLVAALLDELAFWEVDENAAEPDIEVLNAIKPGMATVPGAMLLCASSPHARKGALWDAFRRHYGKDSDEVLVWQADTRSMNPSVRQSYIDQHIAADPARAAAEYGAQFRTDLEQFVSREAVEACVTWGEYERAPQSDVTYIAFADPSGGSGSDSMCLAIGHYDYGAKRVIIDALREQKPPFSPEVVTSEFCALLKTYNVTSVTSDRWGGDWPVEQFRRYGVTCEPAAKVKSSLYVDLLATINSKRIELLDHQRTFNQLISLERRTGRGDHIDHPPGQHDDLSNVVAGIASLALGKDIFDTSWSFVDQDLPSNDDEAAAREAEENARWRQARYFDHIMTGGGLISGRTMLINSGRQKVWR